MPPRQLLPASEGQRRNDITQSQGSRVEKPARIPACELCRQRKIKCDATRPTCGPCSQRETDCRYVQTKTRQIKRWWEESKQRQSVQDDLIDILRHVTEPEGTEILRRLKAGTDVKSIVDTVRGGDLLMQLWLAPESSRRFEFPRLSSMPKHVFIMDNPYLQSILYDVMFPSTVNAAESSGQGGNAHQSAINSSREGRSSLGPGRQQSFISDSSHSAYKIPYRTARLAEPIIESMTPEPWTRVISDSRLLRELVSHYFQYPHPCGPFVHKDLFLADMAAGESKFCSPLLVNALLANAAQSCPNVLDRAKIWRPQSLAYKFTAEARRLWELDSLREATLPTIQASMIMSYILTNNGLEDAGQIYLSRAQGMSEEMQIFHPSNEEDELASKGRAFTAWALFSWSSVRDFYWQRPPYFKQPPYPALPDPEVELSWYGELTVQYPNTQVGFPLLVGYHRHSEATLHTIMDELGKLIYGKARTRSVLLRGLGGIKRKLDTWFEFLPEPLQAKFLISPPHFDLHIQYHQVVASLTQFLLSCDILSDADKVQICGGKSATILFQETRIRFETLIRLYYARHNFEAYDPWMAGALTVLSHMVINELKTMPVSGDAAASDHSSTLVLSTKGLANQATHFYTGTLHGLNIQDAMRPEDLQLVRTYTKESKISKTDEGLIEGYSNFSWPRLGLAESRD